MNTIVHTPSALSPAHIVKLVREFIGGMHDGLTRVDPSETMLLVANVAPRNSMSAVTATSAAIARADAHRDRMRLDAWL